MPMPDASSITPIQPPNLNSLSSMVNLGNQALDMQYKQGTMQSRIAQQAALTSSFQSEAAEKAQTQEEFQNVAKIDPSQFKTPDGTLDTRAYNAAIQKVAPSTWGKYSLAASQADKSATEAKQSVMSLDSGTHNALTQAIATMGNKTPNEVTNQLALMVNNNPSLGPAAWNLDTHLNLATANDPNRQELFMQAAKGLNTLAQQKEIINPSYQNIGGFLQNTNQMAGPGTPQQISNTQSPQIVMDANQQPHFMGGGVPKTPPNMPSVSGVAPQGSIAPNINNAHNLKGFGPQIAPSSGEGSGFPSGVSITQQTQAFKPVNDDWAQTSKTYAGTENLKNILNNIKQHAIGSATGVGSEGRAWAEGALGFIGIKPSGDAKTDYDLLVKNSAMLTNAMGGNSDLARTMQDMANPNHKMTEDAIRVAANQITGQLNYMQEKYKYMQPIYNMANKTGDANIYAQGLQHFQSTISPDATQWQSMDAKDKPAFKASMTDPNRITAFRNHLKTFDAYKAGNP